MSTIYQHFVALVSQREAMKDERTHYGRVDKSTDLWQHVDIQLCEKTWPILPPPLGLMAGSLADEIQVDFKNFKSPVG